MGRCFFVKKVDLSSMQGALCTVSVFFILHFTNLGGAYAPNAPLPTGLRLICETAAMRAVSAVSVATCFTSSVVAFVMLELKSEVCMCVNARLCVNDCGSCEPGRHNIPASTQ